MVQLLRLLCGALIGLLRSAVRREAEILALRHQINVLRRKSPSRPALSNVDRLLFVLLILQHGRRQILWLGVTAHPTAAWIARLLTEAYGWTAAPRYVVRDRDAVYGDVFICRLQAMGIRDRPTAARSPWQNGYAERLIGSIRRDCLDYVV